ncbi:hypothetical protein [Chamaesiphon sp. VAR_69_metabat_338]|uniref:hypothetical protein n=1 Tax=Chamaesiphon sp. VAR_69_metabat_338 TaxID=2964704 RepID=UPI00286E70EF|nr:hypothetical protein [Chamaesiphon sp. VAR_69_metabat_338]
MSGNYQSRVFTFINKRTDRLKDSCAKGLRHIKVAVVWTGQILLYPLQLLGRALDILPPQLEAPSTQRSLPQPAPDISIEQALVAIVDAGYPIEIAQQGELAAVDDWSIIDENIWHTGYGMTAPKSHDATYHPRAAGRMRSKKPLIRGISSLLRDRQLVLVTTENELLDLLTNSQQQELRRQIGIDIAIGWHQWHASQLAASQSTFQISSSDRLLLDREIDDRWLEIVGVNPTSQSLLPQGEVELKERDSRSPTLRDRWHDLLQNFTPKQSEPESIASEVIRELPASPYPFTPQPPRIDRYLDLPQLPPIVESELSPTQDNLVLSSIGKLSPNWLTTWFNYYRDYLYIPSKIDRQIIHQPSEFKLVPIELTPQKARYTDLINKQVENIISYKNNLEIDADIIVKQVERNLEYAPDWIEAESELIGYSRSPLARFLAWLDRIFLAIENWLIKIWGMITNNPARS